MFELRIVFQRKRKLVMRAMTSLAIGLVGLLVVLPRADARALPSYAFAGPDHMVGALLSPEPVSSRRFSMLYAFPPGGEAAITGDGS